MKKPSFSKQAIGNFFLHHTEKLILMLCLALFGLFLWLGLQSKPFDAKSPSQLVSLNDRSDAHVKNPDVWEKIQPYRKGRTDVLGDIEKFEDEGRLKADDYRIDTLSGIPAATLEARKDPILQVPLFPRAQHFRAPLLIATGRKTEDVWSMMTPVGNPNVSRGRSRSDYDDEEYLDEGDDEYEFGGGGKSRGKAKVEEDVMPEVEAGSQVENVHVHTMPGLNPRAHGINADRNKALLRDVVCVTAVLDIKKQFSSYESLAGSVGYYPDRDKPVYQHVEIHRRVKGGKWTDRSELIQFGLPSKYPKMHKMPLSFHSSAPDNAAPEHYDPILTGPIPPVASVNYLPFISHPKLEGKTRTFPDLEGEEEVQDDLFGHEEAGGSGTSQSGGPSAHGGSSARTAEEEFIQTRAGSDFSDYSKALQAKRPTEQYKLVRFFDIVKPNETYEYRIRVWMADPNNEDLKAEFAAIQAEGGGRVGGGGFRGGGDSYEDEDALNDNYESVSRTPGSSRKGSATQKDLGPVYEWVEITSKMKNILVRRRLNKAISKEDPTTGEFRYAVAELRKKETKGADGKVTFTESYETIPVPVSRPYLRFARPSDWSDSVEISVGQDSAVVAVGRVVPPKVVRVKVDGIDTSFDAGEPEADIVAAVWSSTFGAAVPTKQTVSRGELLDFHAPAHMMNPITWKVYLSQSQSRFAQGEDKFKVPVKTRKVLVDVMGGDELPLPRAEKMRHNLASEILVMDSSGKFAISNDIDERTTYRNLLLLPDESQTVGRVKRPKKKKTRDADEYDDEF